MGTHERRYEEHDPPTSGPPMTTTPTRVRDTFERLAAAGEDAIARTRSSDSAAFNSAARQEPGE